MKSIFHSIDQALFECVLLPVSKKGVIYFADSMSYFENAFSVDDAILNLKECGFDGIQKFQLSCVFSTMHGGSGENGAFQGFFELLEIPYVGPSVLGSAVAMDKEIAKRLLAQSGLNVVDSACLRFPEINQEALASQGFPCFVKAASLGSSVGVYKCYNLEQAEEAARKIYELDRKILIEKAVKAREIEVAVLGFQKLQASIAGEIIPHHEFYSYEAKYVDEQGASLELPAKNVDHQELQKLAMKACQVLEIDSMARVDFFIDQENKIYINEINTLPGFTSISMYPKLFEISGISYSDLIKKLILDAIDRFQKNAQLKKPYVII